MPDKDPPDVIRVARGTAPPEFLDLDGVRYRPDWQEVTVDADRKLGQQVYIVRELGEPLDDDAYGDRN